MWTVTLRNAAASWPRLLAALGAAALSVGLLAGSAQLAMQGQAAASVVRASVHAGADLVVEPPPPAPGGVRLGLVSPAVAAEVARVPGVATVAGDSAVPAELAGAGGEVVTGPLDAATRLRPWVADRRLSPYRLVAGRPPAADGEVAIDRHLATAGGLGPGATTTLFLPQASRRVTVVGVVTVGGADLAADRGGVTMTVLMTPEAVRRLAGLGDAWRELRVRGDGSVAPSALADRVGRALGGAAEVRLGSERVRAEIEQATELGLQLGAMLGLLALAGVFVGVFVVASTFRTLVQQRVRQLALLRVVGATARQVRRLIHAEALLVGLVAGLVGLGLGLAFAPPLARLLGRAGIDVTTAGVQFGWAYAAPPLGAAVLTMQLAAWRAARQAAGTSPLAALTAERVDQAPRLRGRVAGALLLAGCAGAAVAAGAALMEEGTGPDTPLMAGGLVCVGGMACCLALAALGPWLTARLGRLVGAAGAAVGGEPGRLARVAVTRAPHRVAAAASMLMVAVALLAGVAMLLTSARSSTAGTGERTLLATHAVTATGATGIPPEVMARLTATPGVAAGAPLVETVADARGPRRSPGPAAVFTGVEVTGTDPARLPELVRLERPGGLARLGDGEAGISERLAAARGWRVGDRITLGGATGDVAVTVVGTYQEPSGLFVKDVLVTTATARRVDPAAVTRAVLLAAAPGTGGDELTGRLEAALGGIPVAAVSDRDGYLRALVRDQVPGAELLYGFFAVAVGVAFLGVATTLSLATAGRTAEFGLLRTIGASARQVRAIVRWEAAIVVVLGTLLGLAVAGATVTAVRAVVGTTAVAATLPLPWLAAIVVVAAVVTLAASALPAARASRASMLSAAQQ